MPQLIQRTSTPPPHSEQFLSDQLLQVRKDLQRALAYSQRLQERYQELWDELEELDPSNPLLLAHAQEEAAQHRGEPA